MQAHFVLYVADQAIARDFYASVLDAKPVLDVPGMTEFQINSETKLGLMPEAGIAKIISPQMPHPEKGSGIPRCELYLFPDDPEKCIQRALDAGAKLIDAFMPRNWGHTVAYLADFDGHILAIAAAS